MAFNNGSVTYICYDCGKSTGGVATVYRDFYGDGSRSETVVCRKGSGCHKITSPYDQPVAAVEPTAEKAHRTIKVAVYVQVEIDVTELENEYGRSFTATEARQDVKDSIYGAVTTAMYPSHSIDKIVKSAKAS